MFELLETYSKDMEAVVLSNFLIEKKDQVILICFNRSLSSPKEIRKYISETFNACSKKLEKCFKNNKNSVDWVDLSNAVERFGSFKAISQAEHSKFVKEAKSYAAKSTKEDDLFAENSKYMSPLMLVNKIKVWRHTANYIDKLHLQDLLYYNILDFTSTNKDDGIHEVLGSFYQAEKEKHQHLYKPSRRVARLARDLLLQDDAQDKDDKSLKSRYKAAKHRLEELKKKVTVEEYDDAKTITKFVKIFGKLEGEKIRLYETSTNEVTYLFCFLRPIFLLMTEKERWLKFNWSEVTLQCKKNDENDILILSEGKATSPTKIDGILIDEESNVEVGLIEVSGPNWKVNTTHFFEDKKKIAKNLKQMYQSLISLKAEVSLTSRKCLKLYGFHCYCKQ
ncbi:hypothetical protein A0J61_06836 [Choanephora cucurbitarum]|uniref:Uncharacterized protein n=1 Tax=Choanephora cucurbitarum TaxID=101091 RepID=A0A1C7NCN1_9FUNG|nr:hypothetical protein A0J61_06836 [Choanephora cucurbitarum]